METDTSTETNTITITLTEDDLYLTAFALLRATHDTIFHPEGQQSARRIYDMIVRTHPYTEEVMMEL